MIFVILFILLWLPLHIIFPMKVIGKKNLPKKGGYVLTCTHSSNWDPILLDIYLGKKIKFLAKRELFDNKFVGWFLKRVGAYPIDRNNPDISAFKYSLGVLKKNKVLGIFPEGTRNKNLEERAIQDIKSGAVTFASKGETFILPMVIYNKAKAFKKNYLIIGEPLKIVGENPKRLTKEEVDMNTTRLAKELERLREEVSNMLNQKKNKKKKEGKK